MHMQFHLTQEDCSVSKLQTKVWEWTWLHTISFSHDILILAGEAFNPAKIAAYLGSNVHRPHDYVCDIIHVNLILYRSELENDDAKAYPTWVNWVSVEGE